MQLCYTYVQPVTKISILLLYLRIFPNKLFRFTIIIFLVYMVCHLLAFIIVVILQCVPVDAVWDLTIPAKCLNTVAITYAGAALSIVEDLAIVFLPIFVLKDLNLTTRKKIALGLMFALGSL
jgi:hypothetical protein